MRNVETLPTEASRTARRRPKLRFPLISTVAAAAVAAGVLAGGAPATTHLDPQTVAAQSASFSLAYVRVAGSSKINQDGVTCYTGKLGFGIGLDSTQMGAKFSYRWIVDGKVLEKGTRSLPSHARSDYFGSKKLVTKDLGTSHKVTFQLTSPQRLKKSTTWVMC
ncbi:hypothetical protein AB0I81_45220 [Nonomuraea sp. NPDC050404]|uniref:hypothetical protein n=1 Tax=Nonomuraea sp. NPDC050404 TaxID=3155783 RepID=UPI0033DB3F31